MPSLIVFGPARDSGQATSSEDGFVVEEDPAYVVSESKRGEFARCRLQGTDTMVWINPALVRFVRDVPS